MEGYRGGNSTGGHLVRDDFLSLGCVIGKSGAGEAQAVVDQLGEKEDSTMVSNAFVEFRELSKKNQRIQDKLKGAKDEAAFATLAVKVGAEEGYKFSVEDVHAWAKDRDILSDEQLNAVKGGGAVIPTKSLYPETFAEVWYMIFYA